MPIVDIITGIVKFNPIPQVFFHFKPKNFTLLFNSLFFFVFFHQGVRVTPIEVAQASEGSCNIPYTMKRMYSVDSILNATLQQGASQAPYSEQGIKKEGFGADDLKQFQSENNLINDPITNIIGNDVVNYVEKVFFLL